MNASTRSVVQLRIPFPEAQGEPQFRQPYVARDLPGEIDRRLLQPAAGLHALLKLWLIAAFIGATAVVSAVATAFEGRQPLRLEIVLASIVVGGALTWYSIRRMSMLLERFDDTSTEDWIED